MSTIDFVVRGDAGAVQRGSMGGSDGAASVVVSSGQDISLNLHRSNILSYMRQGQALQVTLVDGQVLTIQGFFTPEGTAVAELFISANGELSEVELVPGEGNLLYSQYVDADNFGKWSPDDALYFTRGSEIVLAGVVPADDDAGMLGTALLGGLGGLGPMAGLGAAGLGAAALLGSSTGGTVDSDVKGENSGDGDDADDEDTTGSGDGETEGQNSGGGDGGGTPAVTPPVVDIATGTKETGHVVDEEDHKDGVDITGTGTPGATGTITVGTVTKDITIDESGNWTVTFTPEDVTGGEYEVDVNVTVTNGGGSTSTTDTLVVDTLGHVTFDASTVEGEGIVNKVEESDGFTLTGTTEAGSTVVVTFGGNNYNATVTGETWVLDVPAGVVAQGEYDLAIKVTATDQYGNIASTSDILHIDTETSVTINTSIIGGDNTVNAVEHAAGVTVTGLAESNASVVVTLGAVSQTVTADVNGNWTSTFASADVPEGTYELPVKAVSTDVAGNTATATGTVQVDTEINVTVNTAGVEGDGTINLIERADGVTLTGTSQPGASVVVDFAGATRTVTTDASGNWSADYSAASVPSGEREATVTATATDAAGNTATASGTVQIDTLIDVTVDTSKAGGDGTINFVERDGGLTLTGTTDAHASVVVTFAGVSRNVDADASGNWSATWPKGAIPTGEKTVDVTVQATDAAGNVANTSDTVRIDTLVNRLETTAKVEGDDIVNKAEASDGITLNGVVEAGSTVMVTFEGTTRSATVQADGTWSVNFAANEIPMVDKNVSVKIDATDAAGNTATISDTFKLDTVAPAAPDIEDITDRGALGVSGFSILDQNEGLATPDVTTTIHEVKFDNGAPVAVTPSSITDHGTELGVRFAAADYVQDGSHLVVTGTDTGGNTNSTLFVLDDIATNNVNVNAGSLSTFNIGAIDLEFAEDSQLTLSAADLQGLSANDNSLIIHGDAKDAVTLTGTATTAAGSEVINGQTYNVYTFGDDSRLIINEDIAFTSVV